MIVLTSEQLNKNFKDGRQNKTQEKPQNVPPPKPRIAKEWLWWPVEYVWDFLPGGLAHFRFQKCFAGRNDKRVGKCLCTSWFTSRDADS